MHLVQVCNVGDICGGTAACAWSVVRALPDLKHTVLFLSPISPETRTAFAGARLLSETTITQRVLDDVRPDLCLLHNTTAGRVAGPLRVPSILYRHSDGARCQADLEVCCSQWLADRNASGLKVLLQGVPEAPRPHPPSTRGLRRRLIVGRICTPRAHKWPPELVDFYAHLAQRHAHIDWEFVGAPPDMQRELRGAVNGSATFHAAGWNSRRVLWNWDVLLYHHPRLTESFGRTVAEAMRAGCIALVDNRGGFREQITSECGFLCDDLPEFSAALRRLEEWRLRNSMTRAAKRHADEQFSLAGFGARLRELLQTAARSPGRAAIPAARPAPTASCRGSANSPDGGWMNSRYNTRVQRKELRGVLQWRVRAETFSS